MPPTNSPLCLGHINFLKWKTSANVFNMTALRTGSKLFSWRLIMLISSWCRWDNGLIVGQYHTKVNSSSLLLSLLELGLSILRQKPSPNVELFCVGGGVFCVGWLLWKYSLCVEHQKMYNLCWALEHVLGIRLSEEVTISLKSSTRDTSSKH